MDEGREKCTISHILEVLHMYVAAGVCEDNYNKKTVKVA